MAMLDASGATAVMMATALKIFPTSSGSTQRLNRDLQQTEEGGIRERMPLKVYQMNHRF